VSCGADQRLVASRESSSSAAIGLSRQPDARHQSPGGRGGLLAETEGWWIRV